MRILILFLLVLAQVFGEELLEVTAVHFRANELEGIIELTENVEIKKGTDELYAQKVIINIDKDRNPLFYSAYGGVTFKIVTKDGRKMNGKSNDAFYDARSGEYRLVGNGEVHEEGKPNVVKGDEIIVNNETGFLNITGTANKPAKLIFQMDKNEK